MKIAFMWKWWSGKTTLSSHFVKYLEVNYVHEKKLIFDVDINSHLWKELGFISPEPLWINFENIFEILEPSLVNKFWFNNIPTVWTFPITKNSTLIYPDKIDSYWLEKYYTQKNNSFFFESWNFIDQDSWKHNCYHGMLNTYELFIHHIRDSKKDFIIADTTAGGDNLWTSLFMSYDLTCFIVEPTMRSIQVYKDYMKIADQKNIYVIVNKVRSKKDLDFVYSQINKNDILCHFDFNTWVYRWETNDFLINEKNNFELIVNKLFSIEKNWKCYYSQINALYIKEVNGWFSDFHNMDLEKLIISKNKLWE